MAQAPLTREQMQEAVDALEREGEKVAAAVSLGIPSGTFRHRIRRAEQAGIVPKSQAIPPAQAGRLKESAAKAKQEASELKKRLAESERKVAELLEQIKESRKKRTVRLTPGLKPKSKGHFTRFIIPDTHGCFVDKAAFGAMLHDLQALQPKSIVLLGDHLDCAGWLAKHHPFKTIQEARYSFSDDVSAANEQLDAICKAAPKGCQFDYLEGNHEERIEAWCVEQAAQNPKDAEYFYNLHSPRAVLNLDARGIPYFRRAQKHDGLRVRGAIKRGHCYFVHGVSHSTHAADAHLRQFKRNTVFGHTHRAQQTGTADVLNDFAAWCPGCLCELEPMYLHGKQTTDWSHGYGLQFVSPDGTFLHLNVPIIDGKSFLVPFTEAHAA